MDKIIHLGIVNPPLAASTEDTTYFKEGNLKGDDLVGVPVFIEHDTKQPACGVVVRGAIDDKKRVWGAFICFDTPEGKLASKLLGEDGTLPGEERLRELSMGYDVDIVKDVELENKMREYGIELPVLGIPNASKVTEVSICKKGAREGTEIKYSMSLTDFVKSKANTDNANTTTPPPSSSSSSLMNINTNKDLERQTINRKRKEYSNREENFLSLLKNHTKQASHTNTNKTR